MPPSLQNLISQHFIATLAFVIIAVLYIYSKVQPTTSKGSGCFAAIVAIALVYGVFQYLTGSKPAIELLPNNAGTVAEQAGQSNSSAAAELDFRRCLKADASIPPDIANSMDGQCHAGPTSANNINCLSDLVQPSAPAASQACIQKLHFGSLRRTYEGIYGALGLCSVSKQQFCYPAPVLNQPTAVPATQAAMNAQVKCLYLYRGIVPGMLNCQLPPPTGATANQYAQYDSCLVSQVKSYTPRTNDPSPSAILAACP